MLQRKLSPMLCVMGAAIALLATGCEEAAQYLPPLPRIEIPSDEVRSPQQNVQSANNAKIEAAIRQGINEVRQENKLKPMQNNEKLAQVARNYSRQMAEQNFFSHTGADGSTLEKRVRAGGIYYWVVGENLFKSKNISQPVSPAIDGWMKSPGHRENILRPFFSETGVGVWKVGNTYYITQLFLRR
ncbi:MAG: CAP domain-containing protein [Tolypothrix sp. Co-bin9]|nr:CAP domain-containing protein [Tolypothrix sp. Co-bin9]